MKEDSAEKLSENYDRSRIHFIRKGVHDGHVFIWAHGWGQSHASFLDMINSLPVSAEHYAVDLPGMGASPVPETVWDTEDYADIMAAFIKDKTTKPIIWVGHSFGCRVGIQIAAKYPHLIKGMALIAGAGLKRKRPVHTHLYIKAKIYAYKSMKQLVPLRLISEAWLKSKFGSADFKSAGPMRAIFVKTVNEDLSIAASKVACPTLLIYGTNDTETPPEIGKRLAHLIPSSEMVSLDGQDHYSVLGKGRHQVVNLLNRFVKTISLSDF